MNNMYGYQPQQDPATYRLQQEIDGMELKKQSLLSAVNGEIVNAKQQINNELFQIGSKVYQCHLDKKGYNGLDGLLGEHYDNIAAQNKIIEEKEEKLKDITARYDDEINLMRTQLNAAHQNPQGAAGGAPCPGCGRLYTPGIDKFCMGCGRSLPVAVSQAAAPTAGGAACPKCGRAYTPGTDKFCDVCGTKLD